jgi:hypothetical protein
MNFAMISFCVWLLRNFVLWFYGDIIIFNGPHPQSLVCWNVCSVIILRFLFAQNSCFDLSVILDLFVAVIYLLCGDARMNPLIGHSFFLFVKEVSLHFKPLNGMLSYSTRFTTRRNNFLLRWSTCVSILWIAWCTVNVR